MIVIPESDAVTPDATSNTRLFPLPETDSTSWPGPTIDTSWFAIVSSPLVSVIVPLRPAAKSISLGPVVLLESMIAWRSEPPPLSFRLVTLKCESSVRPSRYSTVQARRER